MIPIQLILRGIGPHTNTVINFRELKSPLALVAPFGSGKTTLLEGILAALYGDYAWYGCNIYDLMTQGGTGKAEINLVFDQDGIEYEIARKLRQTAASKSHTAVLFKLGEKVPLAGPKIGDCLRAIENLVGSKEHALATWFFAQNRQFDLCGQPGDSDLRARRRRVLGQLINLDKLDVTLALIVDVIGKTKGTVAELTAQLADEVDPAEEIAQLEEAAEVDNAMRQNYRAALSREESALEAARKALRDAEAGDGELQARIDSVNAAFDALGAAENAHGLAEDELRRVSQIAANLEDNHEAVLRRGVLMGNLDRLKELQKAHDAQERWMQVNDRLCSRIESEREAIADLEKSSGVDAETEALAGKLTAIRDEGITAKAANEARMLRNNERAAVRRNINSKIDGCRARISSITDRIGGAPDVLFGDKCLPCPFMAEFASLPKELDSLKVSAQRLGAELDAIEPDEELVDLAEIRGRYEQAKAASDAVDRATESRKTVDRRRVDLEALEIDLAEHRKIQPEGEPVDDQSDLIAEIGGKIEELNGADERLKSCQEAADRLPDLKAKVKVSIEKVIQAKEVYSERLPAAESAKKALADRENQREGLRSDIANAEATIRNTRRDIDDLTQKIADKNARINALEDREKATEAKRERLREQSAYLDGLNDLRIVFGPSGARQILVDAAAPELETIANDMFRIATDGAMSLRIATQTPLADGSLAEDFAILVQDSRGERDVTEHSGGELQLCQIIFRIAVAIWIGRRRQLPPECLILDEAFDRLGAEGTDDLMRVIDWLKDQIELMVLVTHDMNIADRLPARIQLKKYISGVEVISNDN